MIVDAGPTGHWVTARRGRFPGLDRIDNVGEEDDPMARSWLSPSMVRWSSGLLASVAMVAAVTGVIVLLERHIPVLNLLVLYRMRSCPLRSSGDQVGGRDSGPPLGPSRALPSTRVTPGCRREEWRHERCFW